MSTAKHLRQSILAAGLALTALFPHANVQAACSADYFEVAYLNEYYFGTSTPPGNFLEVYIPNNNKVLAADVENWSIQVTDGSTTQTYSLSSTTSNYCTFGSKTFITHDVPGGLPGEGDHVNVILLDGDGNEIDYLKFSKQSPVTEHISPQCSYPPNHDIDFTAPNFGNKDIARFPDGKGDWSVTGETGANTTYTQCTSNDAGLTKLVSAAAIPVNTIASFTLTANNPGNQSVSSVTITETWPAGLTYDSHTATAGTYTPATGVWDIGTLAKNSSAELTINFFGDTVGTYENMATLQYSDNKGTYTVDEYAIAEIVPPVVTVPDHFRFHHDGSGLTCTPETITVEACQDTNCTSQYPDPITATLTPTGWVGGDTLTFNSGDTLQLWYTSVGSPTLGIASSSSGATNPPRCFVAGVEQASCAIPFYDSGFLFDVPDHNAGTTQNVTLAAVRSSDSTQRCVPAFTGDKTVSFWSSYGDPASGTQQLSVNGQAVATAGPGAPLTLTFDGNGETQLDISYPDVGSLQLNARYEGSAAVGDDGLIMLGQDSFVVRPDHFTLSSITCADGTANPAATGPAGSGFCAAGQAFTFTVGARNASGNLTPNFGRESNGGAGPESVALTTNIVSPAGGNNPALNGTLSAFSEDCAGNAASAGTACGSFSWPEVGIITLTPSVADGNYLGAGPVSGTTTGNIGRFYADHFSLSLSSADLAPANGSFTYIGQDFGYSTAPDLSLIAEAVGGQRLYNYEGNYWKLGSEIIAAAALTDCQSGNYSCYSYSDNVGGTSGLQQPSAPETFSTYIDTATFAGSNTLTAFQSGALMRYTKPATPISPFDADIHLQIYLEDSDGASGSVQLGSIGFTAAYESDTAGIPFNTTNDSLLRYGRASLQDTVARGTGAGTVAALPLQMQYFDGEAFVDNIDDSSSTVVHSTAAPALDCSDPDTANDTLTCAKATLPASVSVVSGAAFPITLSSAINDEGGTLLFELNNATLPANSDGSHYLTYDWSGDGTLVTDDTNPAADRATATVTFAPPSYYHGDRRFLYWQESP